MRRFTFCLLLLLVMTLLSCSLSDKELSGMVVYGHEARTVRLCGETKVFWLHTTTEQNLFLMAEFKRLTHRPFQELYLDFTGSQMHDSPGELAREYDGTIRLEEIRKLSIGRPDHCNTVRTTP